MDHGVDRVLLEERIDGGLVAEIHRDQRNLAAEDGAYPLVVGFIAVGEVVGDDHVIAGLDKFHGYVAADESGSAGHENGLFHSCSSFQSLYGRFVSEEL